MFTCTIRRRPSFLRGGAPGPQPWLYPRGDGHSSWQNGCLQITKLGPLTPFRRPWTSERPTRVVLEQPLPVQMTYYTVVVHASGEIGYFGDVYGYDQSRSEIMASRYLENIDDPSPITLYASTN